MDGESGPGVGSARIVVHEGWVGMIMFGEADATLVGDAGDVTQAVVRIERIKESGNKKVENFGMFDSVCRVKHTYLIAS